jgi:hypothetical protein
VTIAVRPVRSGMLVMLQEVVMSNNVDYDNNGVNGYICR